MTETMLPSSINYNERLHSLPSGTTAFEYVATPVNGSNFGAQSQIIVDLGSVGMLDPASLFIRYSIVYTAGAVSNSLVCGTPVYTPISRLDTLFNSQVVDTISMYGVLGNLQTNLSMTISDKMGHPELGYEDATLNNQNTDGAQVANAANTASAPYFYSAPLIGILANCDKLVPLFMMNSTRLVFTLESVANVVSNIAPTSMSAFTISNFEVVYNCVQFPAEVERELLMSPKLSIKTSSYSLATAPQIPQGSSGSLTLQYNMRYASVRSCVLIGGGTSATLSANRSLDSYDITQGQGDFSFVVGGFSFPQRPLSTTNNKAGIITELRKTIGSIFGSSVPLAISRQEFNAPMITTPTTVHVPAKFWVGVNMNKLTLPSRTLFNGISTQLSPINVNININTPTGQAINPTLVVHYDSVIEIDTATRQVLMIQ